MTVPVPPLDTFSAGSHVNKKEKNMRHNHCQLIAHLCFFSMPQPLAPVVNSYAGLLRHSGTHWHCSRRCCCCWAGESATWPTGTT